MINRRNLLIKGALLTSLSFNILNTGNTKKAKHVKLNKPIIKSIHSSKEKISSIGMGTWLTFDVGYNTKNIAERTNLTRKQK